MTGVIEGPLWVEPGYSDHAIRLPLMPAAADYQPPQD